MTTSQNKSGFFIGVTCPGCGGELELEENFFVLTCSHCGSALRVVPPDTPPAFLAESRMPKREVRFHADRFLKKSALPLTESGVQIKALYYPYWKVDAVVLKTRHKVIERFVADDDDPYSDGNSYEQKRTEVSLSRYSTSLPAGCQFEGLPYSLGLRTGYLKVVPFARENIPGGFDSLPVLVTWPDALDRVKMSAQTIGHIDPADFGKNKTELFHPVGSLIYFPYYIMESYAGGQLRRLVIDGVTGRVWSNSTQLSPIDPAAPAETPDIEFGRLVVEFHRCSNCGVDLPTEQSFVYICDNCHVLTTLEKHSFVAREIEVAASRKKNISSKLLPFWSFKLSGKDAARVQKLMGGIYASDRFVVPGFKVTNFEAAYRLAKRMSAALPKLDMAPVEKFDARFLPTTVGPSEAETLGRAIVYRQEVTKNPRCAPGEIDIQVKEARLFYAPFHPEHYFYVDSIVGAVTFEKSLVD